MVTDRADARGRALIPPFWLGVLVGGILMILIWTAVGGSDDDSAWKRRRFEEAFQACVNAGGAVNLSGYPGETLPHMECRFR